MARYFFHFPTGRTSRTLRALSLRALKDARDAAVVFMGKKLKDLDGEFLARGPMVHPRREQVRRDPPSAQSKSLAISLPHKPSCACTIRARMNAGTSEACSLRGLSRSLRAFSSSCSPYAAGFNRKG